MLILTIFAYLRPNILKNNHTYENKTHHMILHRKLCKKVFFLD